MRQNDPEYTRHREEMTLSDKDFHKHCDWKTRLVLRLFPKQVNKIASASVMTASGRGILDSWTLHEITGIQHHMIWPER